MVLVPVVGFAVPWRDRASQADAARVVVAILMEKALYKQLWLGEVQGQLSQIEQQGKMLSFLFSRLCVSLGLA